MAKEEKVKVHPLRLQRLRDLADMLEEKLSEAPITVLAQLSGQLRSTLADIAVLEAEIEEHEEEQKDPVAAARAALDARRNGKGHP